MKEEDHTATYRFGGTTIYVVAPNISEEERKKRLEEIQRIIWSLWIEKQSE
ncbi:hypothetical protein C8P63_12416 [Melghirimyces profundicolus]|uniref:Uncharacterized protein n=1 Tax=Melghirimyces profundicolus TaxID=1242148 RepID=A0A2T6BD08_9BACL|nr:cell division protein FtsZ [Melghirimyces profundicolus]PTX53960.1 hypothetical protein C8P63_12416 [Melghirimyces profundicolus]